MKHFPKQTERAHLQRWTRIYKNWDEPLSPETITEWLEKDRTALYTGNKSASDLWDVPLGIFNDSEISYAINACRAELTRNNQSIWFNKIDECVELCGRLATEENHILVPSGQYVEKPMQIASTQEMINQATQTLAGLPQYTAYAKILTPDDVWQGQIKTYPLPEKTGDNADIMEQIEQITREKCYRPRSEVASEIADRRARWRATVGGSAGDEPPPSRARN